MQTRAIASLWAGMGNVYKLTILIEANHDDAEETVIEQLAVHGAPPQNLSLE